MITLLLTWLNKYLAIIRWVVLGLAMITSAWATHRIDGLLATEKVVIQTQKEIQVVHDVKTIHDRVNAMPNSDISKQLLSWQRD